MTTADVVVLLFGRRLPRPLAGLPIVSLDDIEGCRRVIVVGSEADLAAVLTRLLRAERLDVEVAHATNTRTARGAMSGVARRIPLIRDETGTVIVGAAQWVGSPPETMLHGEAVVDDTVLFDGDVPGVRIEPTRTHAGASRRGAIGPRPSAALGDRARGAAGHHRCAGDPRRCRGAAAGQAVDLLPAHRGLAARSALVPKAGVRAN